MCLYLCREDLSKGLVGVQLRKQARRQHRFLRFQATAFHAIVNLHTLISVVLLLDVEQFEVSFVNLFDWCGLIVHQQLIVLNQEVVTG